MKMSQSKHRVDPQLVAAWQQSLGEDERAALSQLVELEQSHLLEAGGASAPLAGRKRLLAQWVHLDRAYPGGLARYLENARGLLSAARTGHNPYAGLTPTVPSGTHLAWGTPEFARAHRQGLELAGRTGFVLVAGGMGERLGYPGIKLSLPVECATGRCYLQYYIEQILALQKASKGPGPLPLALMTSGQTHEATSALLEENAFFGMTREQVTLMRQEEVAALADDRPSLIISDDDPFEIQTKPHGHGDVHALMHSTGTALRWAELGLDFVVFFQDTNALVFHAIPPSLAVAREGHFAMNTITVPRKAGEAVGGIARLVGASAEGAPCDLTVNVEYNQLDPLLRATGSPEGDVGDESGLSPFPGNTNALIVDLKTYVRTLQQTGGGVPEFVNPKYADATRTRFLKPTRLECMMQDYPRALPTGSVVGFTSFERSVCFSAVKNAVSDAARRAARGLPPESAGSAEGDLYSLHRRILQDAGARLEAAPPLDFQGVPVPLFPIVVLSAEMLLDAPLRAAEAGRKPSVDSQHLHMSARSSLIVRSGRVRFEGVRLQGELEVRAHPDATVVLRDLTIENEGRLAEAVPEGAAAPLAIRGYRLTPRQSRVIELPTPGEHVVDARWLAASPP